MTLCSPGGDSSAARSRSAVHRQALSRVGLEALAQPGGSHFGLPNCSYLKFLDLSGPCPLLSAGDLCLVAGVDDLVLDACSIHPMCTVKEVIRYICFAYFIHCSRIFTQFQWIGLFLGAPPDWTQAQFFLDCFLAYGYNMAS